MSKNKKIYRAGSYRRLSQDDGNGEVSNSIVNQTELIQDFEKSHSDIHIVAEYDDDGYSGTNFDRPAFKRMLEDVKAGKINCIIVKDLSRLGRNYIEVGKYVERIFPFMGVRFISINDHYDSAGPKNESDTLMLPFKNLMNDSYCRDISVKIRSHLEVRRKKGKYISAFAVYGYKKSEKDHNQLVVDEYAADVVKLIFQMKLWGKSQSAISDYLDENGILSPMEYKKSKGEKFTCCFKVHNVATWSPKAVQRILTNEIYLGITIQGKTERPNYKVKTQIEKKPEDWIRVENTHEAIISYHEFWTIQELLKRDTRMAPQQDNVYLFSGFLYCGDCKNTMVRKLVPSGGRKYSYYVCFTNKAGNGCSTHCISEKKLTENVFRAVTRQIASVCHVSEILSYIDKLPENQRTVFNYDAQIEQLREEIIKYKTMKMKLYEDLTEGIIDQDEYREYRSSFMERIEMKEKALAHIEMERTSAIEGAQDCNPWLQYFMEYENAKELNRQMVVTLIHKVFVYDNGSLEVVFRYKDEMDALFIKIRNYQDELQSAMPLLAAAQ
ncbi:MAG: recombinase [Clostridia bacterium]|nr:recombinase [Clostridia bacterium]